MCTIANKRNGLERVSMWESDEFPWWQLEFFLILVKKNEKEGLKSSVVGCC